MQKKMRSFVGVLLAMVLVFGSTFPSVAADQLYMEPEEEMGISLKEAGIDEIDPPGARCRGKHHWRLNNSGCRVAHAKNDSCSKGNIVTYFW